MTTVTIPPELQLKLQSLQGRAMLCGEDGRLVGYFDSKPTYEDIMATCPYTEAELAEFARSPDSGRTTADILRELEAKWPIE